MAPRRTPPSGSSGENYLGAQQNKTYSTFLPKYSEGIPIVLPPPEILEAPNFASLQRIVDNLWNKALLGSRVQVSSAGNNLFIFSFNTVSTRDWVLENDPWHIQNKPLILRKWEPNMKRLSFNLSKIPVWVHLYNVPLELFSRTDLSYIVSAIGVPLSMDSVTTSKSRLEYAKICIEIRFNDEIPKYIDVVLKEGHSTSIQVEIPWLPPSCKNYKVFGHTDKGCLQKPNSAPPVIQVWKKKGETKSNIGSSTT
ncbi:uncharacterized protein LOC120171707 [Hibiscus syriacus]|uniref:uncharacterized protein LOC120171707 n=1 Tax=Hibiscus syriacus TaxID=106335 RepID=UPI00192492CB|nr:uncharacterized protein LOC120171707 [Hibiscus syriacus]